MDFYRDSTWILEVVESKEKDGVVSGSLQNIVLQSCKRFKLKTNPKHIYAIVNSTWKYKTYLEKIMKKSGILDDVPVKKGKPVFTKLTLMLLCHDLLLSKSRRIQMGKHPIKSFVLKYKTRLSAELTKLKVKLKVKSLSEIVDSDDINNDITPVRWIRINPLRCSREHTETDILQELCKKFTQRVDHWSKIKSSCIYYDDYIPNLFGISPQDKITSHELYKQGKIIIQDRASCFPAHILNPQPHDMVIDACAAPGNKTTHVAAYMFSNSKDQHSKNFHIDAFEKDPQRAIILQQMIKTAGCSKQIKCNVGDFTEIAKIDKFPEATKFIVDPSCSGSGIFGRKYIDSINKQKNQQSRQNEVDDEDNVIPDEHDEDNVDDREKNFKKQVNLETRLAKLASFQFQVVKHAMSFPKADKIVYSTCSIHAEENERVVIDLLLDKKVKQWGWKVATRSKVIPNWERRGFVDEFKEVFRDQEDYCQELADGCIRVLPKEDGGIGFFAVCFERDVSKIDSN